MSDRAAYHPSHPRRAPAAGRAHAAPVVFVHGGPGVADMRGDAAYFGRLTTDGYAGNVYDELGTGRSSRLEDPRGYTLERDVEDLAAIRAQLGAERLILIGHSYGAVVAAAAWPGTPRPWSASCSRGLAASTRSRPQAAAISPIG